MDGFSNSCHSCHGQASSAANAYTWLKGAGEIMGTASPIAMENNSILAIFGGSMPPRETIDAAAKCALIEWAAAGALDN
jgi:hypothetical protein